MLANCRVALVRTESPGNIGAVARVMGNMGLERLTLVAPACDPLDPRALQMATHGEGILRAAEIVDDLDRALADAHHAVATSANIGGLFRKQTVGPPDLVAGTIAHALRGGQRVVLVFGPESTGLTSAEVSRCQELIHIPTSDSHLSLNLAQAVAICAYEVRKAWLSAPSGPRELPATLAEQERLFAHLKEAFEAIHFLYGDKAEPLMHGIRHLLGKAELTEMETKLLHGLARQILWFARNANEG